jgi:hypothetical protein
MTTLADLRAALDAPVAELAPDALPDFIGLLASASVRAQARLTGPVAMPVGGATALTAERLRVVAWSARTTHTAPLRRLGDHE